MPTYSPAGRIRIRCCVLSTFSGPGTSSGPDALISSDTTRCCTGPEPPSQPPASSRCSSRLVLFPPSLPHRADSRSPFSAGAGSPGVLTPSSGGRSRARGWGAPGPSPSRTAWGPELPRAGSRAITLITARPPPQWRARPRRPENAPGPGRAWEPPCPPPGAAAAAASGARPAARGAARPACRPPAANSWAALGALTAPSQGDLLAPRPVPASPHRGGARRPSLQPDWLGKPGPSSRAGSHAPSILSFIRATTLPLHSFTPSSLPRQTDVREYLLRRLPFLVKRTNCMSQGEF